MVEDNETLASGVMMVLTDCGHEVVLVDRGRKAIGMIAHFKPAAVILDVSLPDIDGVQVAAFIRQDHPDLPIVFASGHAGDSPRLAGAVMDRRTAILRKPYEIEGLLETIARLMK